MNKILKYLMIDFLNIANYYYYNKVNYIVGNTVMVSMLMLRSIIFQLLIGKGIIDETLVMGYLLFLIWN